MRAYSAKFFPNPDPNPVFPEVKLDEDALRTWNGAFPDGLIVMALKREGFSRVNLGYSVT